MDDKLDPKFENRSQKFAYFVITKFVGIEEVIADIIAFSFSKNEKEVDKFLKKVWNEYSFPKRVKTMETILQNNHSDILDQFPQLFNQIKRVRDWRNKLAHSQSGDYLMNLDGSNPRMIIRDKNKPEEEINEKIIDEISDLIFGLWCNLKEIQSQIIEEKEFFKNYSFGANMKEN